MVLNNSVIDDYRSTEGYYECRSCRTRTVSETHLSSCPDCGGSVRNIAVARE
ncbi:MULTISPECIES: rubrerythrin-like domain-containing protein [unclassified Haloferax]|uniref:rubrerythrin-like domain-containing protein n=1 Tax=unclassified Haloferax TaxID=2625095 RepID=UPI000AD898FD|nr:MULTISPECIES: rubrerythrin-like domain-containing protein [unclassified Haloferax]MDS0239868.1 rubrerythrin-like domain-containing protein [Haloferax sp. S2CR25]MDS0442989.1 rubrerythrin-like domain-containing protein [Haloferax sp. S2CR25-2]